MIDILAKREVRVDSTLWRHYSDNSEAEKNTRVALPLGACFLIPLLLLTIKWNPVLALYVSPSISSVTLYKT